MIKHLLTPVTLAAAAFIFALGFLINVSPVTAQGTSATPPDQGEPAETASHPAHIHSGACAELGDVVFPLNNVTATTDGATPVASPHGMAASPAAGAIGTLVVGGGQIVAQSTTKVEAPLDDILAAEHAINVHETEQTIQNYIACGYIPGEQPMVSFGLPWSDSTNRDIPAKLSCRTMRMAPRR